MTSQRSIFGTDGIRGTAGEYPLDPATVLRIGRAIGRWIGQTTSGDETPMLAIGCDTRLSSYTILHGLTAGLLAEGVSVTIYGVATTPELIGVARAWQIFGIVVTASHNPYQQNGIKLIGRDGFKLSDAQEAEIEQLLADPTLEQQPARFAQSVTVVSYDGYENDLHLSIDDTSSFMTLSGLSVILDCAYGAAAYKAERIFASFGASAIEINGAPAADDLDGGPNGLNINLNAGSEHVRRDRSALLAAMHAHAADLGIAFDGDADRVVFVTPDGMLIDGDHVLGILAVQMQAAGTLTGNTVVATDMSNSGLEHFLGDHGITLVRTQVGDRYVMERMRAGGFALGGEQAGHVILLDDAHTAGDGIYVGLLVAALVAQHKRSGGASLSDLARQIPRYPQVIASAHLVSRADLTKVAGLDALIAQTLTAFDGKGRVNVRFSGTEPNLLRAMVEGGPSNTLPDVVARALAICRLVASVGDTPDPRIDVVDCVTGAPVQT